MRAGYQHDVIRCLGDPRRYLCWFIGQRVQPSVGTTMLSGRGPQVRCGGDASAHVGAPATSEFDLRGARES